MASLFSSRLPRAALVTLAALVLGVGCSGNRVGDSPPNDLGRGDLELLPQGRLWEPAKDGDLDYRVVPPSRESKQFKQTLGSGGKRIIYLNQHGGTYTPGWDDSASNRSSIIDGTVRIAPYRAGARAWTELKTCLAKEYARWNVTVTDVDPGQVPHVEAVIGGMPGAVGLPKSIDGVAPMSNNGAVIERAVVYVFAENVPNAQYACQVAAHEVGHAYGLEHEYLCADPMTYLEGCGHKTFQDKPALCGTDAPVKCRNGGKQNTVLHLNEVLGLAKDGGDEEEPSDDDDDAQTTTPPKVSLLAPKDGAAFEPQTTVAIKANVKADAKLMKVVLLWGKDGQTTDVDCAAPVSGTTCSHSGSSYTWTVRVGKGPRTWSIKATDVAGNTATSAKRTLSFADESAPPQPGPEPPIVPQLPKFPAPPELPDPTTDDDAFLVSPAEGAIAHPGAQLPVVVAGNYLAVWIVWSGPSGSQIHKLERDDDDDGAWKTKLQIAGNASPGARTLQVMAVDAEGATIKGLSRKIVVK